MILFHDIHTHNFDANNAIISVNYSQPFNFQFNSSKFYSLAIHPWDSSNFSAYDTTYVEEIIKANPNIIMIGETGIDLLRGDVFEKQKELFISHAKIAEKLNKPLILHNVRATNHIISLYKELKPSSAWIIHGFRLKPQVANDLLRAGIYYSFGIMHNSKTVAETPLDKILIETDEASDKLDLIYNTIASIKNISPQQLKSIVANNISRILNF